MPQDPLKIVGQPKPTPDAAGTRQLSDPVLGEMTWNVFWQGAGDVPPFGPMKLTVDTDGPEPPGDACRGAWIEFRRVATALYPQVEQANWRYVQKVLPAYTLHRPELRQIDSPQRLREHLFDAAVHIPVQEPDQPWRLELDWNCTWDEEHGHAVYIVGGKITNVGIQGDEYEPASG